MNLSPNTIVILLLILGGAYWWSSTHVPEARGATVTSCTYTEPATWAALQTAINGTNVTLVETSLSSVSGTLYTLNGTTPWSGGVEVATNFSGTCAEWSRLQNASWTDNASITVTRETLNDHAVYIRGDDHSVLWCNQADTLAFYGALANFVEYAQTYASCTAHVSTSAEEACKVTTQPAVWNGTACRCVVTGYALDAAVTTATCAAKVKALNETCGGPANETCVGDTKCVLEKDATVGLCTSRTWLDKSIDYIKDHALWSILIGGVVLLALNTLGTTYVLNKKGDSLRRKRR